MRFVARYLSPPICVFNNGKERRGGDERFRGLRSYGPYDSSQVPHNPTLLFVFPQEYRDFANQIYHGLRTGNNQFPGMVAMFGVNLTRESVMRSATFTTQGLSRQAAAESYKRSIEDTLKLNGRPDFALVICEKTQDYEMPSPYYASKSILSASDIPSQVVTIDLLNNPNQLAWSLANIGLQIFVKLGGHPWFVRPSPGGGDIVVGIGRSERISPQGDITRYVGYTTAYTSAGVLKSVEVFRPETNLDDYLEGFQVSITQALRRVLSDPSDLHHLVLHVPKKFSRLEEERLNTALNEMSQWIAGYVVLRVNDEHPFHLFDGSHKSLAPLSGLNVELDKRNRLLLLEGRPTEGNMRRSPPAPLWVTLQTSNVTSSNVDALVQQIYELSVANWRGFNAKARPITTYYSKLIARILNASESNDVIEAIAASTRLRNVPWFI